MHFILKSIVFIPILSAVACGLFGRFVGYEGAKILSTFLISFTCFISCYAFYIIGLVENTSVSILLGSWINSDLFYVD